MPYSWEQSLGRSVLGAAPAASTAWSLRWWILCAMVTSGALHIGMFYLLRDLEFADGSGAAETAVVYDDHRFLDQIKIDPKLLENTLAKQPELQETEQPPLEITKELPPIDQIAQELKTDVIVSPETKVPLNIEMRTKKAGEPGAEVDVVSALEMALEAGDTKIKASSNSDVLKTAKVHDDQVKIAISDKPPTGTDALKGELAAARKKGQDGLNGLGFSSLDDLMDLKTPTTGDLKAMMPSDLLFDYNSAVLRETAKPELIKLGTLIFAWTNSTIIIEGHTDTLGSEEYNAQLSLQRAQAVRDFIVKSLLIDDPTGRIQVKGLGESNPIADPNGDVEKQALNRRVVIRFINP